MKKIILFFAIAFSLLGSISTYASSQTAGPGTSMGNNWTWRRGFENGRHFSISWDARSRHGTGIFLSNSIKHHSGLRNINTTASSFLHTSAASRVTYHKFANRVPIQLLTNTDTDDYNEIPTEVDNQYFHAFVDLDDVTYSFVFETLNPGADLSNHEITTIYTENGFVEDDKMILIDEKGTYQEQVKEIVKRNNRNRNSEFIDVQDVLDEINSHLETKELHPFSLN